MLVSGVIKHHERRNRSNMIPLALFPDMPKTKFVHSYSTRLPKFLPSPHSKLSRVFWIAFKGSITFRDLDGFLGVSWWENLNKLSPVKFDYRFCCCRFAINEDSVLAIGQRILAYFLQISQKCIFPHLKALRQSSQMLNKEAIKRIRHSEDHC
jgi:hypothetical protein